MGKNFFSFRTILFAGVILAVITVIILGIFFVAESNRTKIKRQEDNFSKALYEYDLLAGEVPGLQRDFDRLGRELDRLEKMIISADSWMSLLKRRRALWLGNTPSFGGYLQSLENALNAYPMHPAVTALACEVFVKDKAITPQAEAVLRSRLEVFTSAAYNDILLSLHVLLGDFKNPQRAMKIKPYVIPDGTESIAVNFILLKILNKNLEGASQDIQTMFYTLAPSLEALRFMGEFYYDFGELEKSAEFFNMIDDEKAMSRASDALYLAGFTGNARNIWRLLSAANSLAQRREGAEDAEKNFLFLEKSLYNLGYTSNDDDEARSYFEELININIDNEAISDFKQFGLIRYSRLLDTEQALEVLKTHFPLPSSLFPSPSSLLPSPSPYIDLEIIKRQLPKWQLARQMAEGWLLVDRHSDDMDLHRWVSWLFLFQRNFTEQVILLDRIEGSGIQEQWVHINRAIELMYAGELEKAENILKNIPKEDADWTVSANLGRIMEAQRRPRLAVQEYELAMAARPDNAQAAKIQIRMARCYLSLNRPLDAGRALEHALELEPGNLQARLELERL